VRARGAARRRTSGLDQQIGDQQYTMAAAVAVMRCSCRSTVDDRSGQHITVVAAAVVC
jgi:hypothetical protein